MRRVWAAVLTAATLAAPGVRAQAGTEGFGITSGAAGAGPQPDTFSLLPGVTGASGPGTAGDGFGVVGAGPEAATARGATAESGNGFNSAGAATGTADAPAHHAPRTHCYDDHHHEPWCCDACNCQDRQHDAVPCADHDGEETVADRAVGESCAPDMDRDSGAACASACLKGVVCLDHPHPNCHGFDPCIDLLRPQNRVFLLAEADADTAAAVFEHFDAERARSPCADKCGPNCLSPADAHRGECQDCAQCHGGSEGAARVADADVAAKCAEVMEREGGMQCAESCLRGFECLEQPHLNCNGFDPCAHLLRPDNRHFLESVDAEKARIVFEHFDADRQGDPCSDHCPATCMSWEDAEKPECHDCAECHRKYSEESMQHAETQDLEGQSCDEVWTDCHGCTSTGGFCGTPSGNQGEEGGNAHQVYCGRRNCPGHHGDERGYHDDDASGSYDYSGDGPRAGGGDGFEGGLYGATGWALAATMGGGGGGNSHGRDCWENYQCDAHEFCNRDEDPEKPGHCGHDQRKTEWERGYHDDDASGSYDYDCGAVTDMAVCIVEPASLFCKVSYVDQKCVPAGDNLHDDRTMTEEEKLAAETPCEHYDHALCMSAVMHRCDWFAEEDLCIPLGSRYYMATALGLVGGGEDGTAAAAVAAKEMPIAVQAMTFNGITAEKLDNPEVKDLVKECIATALDIAVGRVVVISVTDRDSASETAAAAAEDEATSGAENPCQSACAVRRCDGCLASCQADPYGTACTACAVGSCEDCLFCALRHGAGEATSSTATSTAATGGAASVPDEQDTEMDTGILPNADEVKAWDAGAQTGQLKDNNPLSTSRFLQLSSRETSSDARDARDAQGARDSAGSAAAADQSAEGQVQRMRGLVQELQGKVTNLQGTIKGLKGEVGDLKNQLADMTAEDKTVKATEQLQEQLLLTTQSSFLQLRSRLRSGARAKTRAKTRASGQFQASLVYAIEPDPSAPMAAAAFSTSPSASGPSTVMSDSDAVVAKMETLFTNTAVINAVEAAIQDVAGIEDSIEVHALSPMGLKQIEHSVKVAEHRASAARGSVGTSSVQGPGTTRERERVSNTTKTNSSDVEGPEASADFDAFAKDAGRRVAAAATVVVGAVMATAVLL